MESPNPESVRYRLTLAYVGTDFAGWQRQPNATTVQELVEAALADLLGETVTLTGAGRTDAGVHARGQVAHFDLPREFAPGGLVHGTNHRLPPAIRVLAAGRAAPEFHARYSATSKEYRYRCVRRRDADPFEQPFALAIPETVDLARLRYATLHLPGRHDFAAFALAGGAHKTTVRSIYFANWRDDGPELSFEIVGEGFLRGMVRGLVGTLLEVGLGRRSAADFAALLEGDGRDAAGPTAPAHGLTLERVGYHGNAVVTSSG